MAGSFVYDDGHCYEFANTSGIIYVVVDDHEDFSWNFQHKVRIRVVLDKTHQNSQGCNHQSNSSVLFEDLEVNNCDGEITGNNKVETPQTSAYGLEVENKFEPRSSPSRGALHVDCDNDDFSDFNNRKDHRGAEGIDLPLTCTTRGKKETGKKKLTDMNVSKTDKSQWRNYTELGWEDSGLKRKTIMSTSLERKKSCRKRKLKLHKASNFYPEKKKVAQEMLGAEVDACKKVSCKYCGKAFVSEQELKDHRSYVVGDDEPYECDICHSKHKYKAFLLVHQYHDHPANLEDGPKAETAGVGNSPYSCFICKKSFVLQRGLKHHMRAHTDEHSYMCCVCGKKTNWLKDLLRHCEVDHLGHRLKVSQFHCNPCNKTFHSRGELISHQKTHKISCNFCGEVFPHLLKRVAHLASSHYDVAPQCPICQQFCNSDVDLQKHLRYHRFHSKKQCSLCGAFVVRLDLHMTKHGQPKTMACDQCPKVFLTKAQLKNHSRIHTGEKPHRCDICFQDFRHRSTLIKHIRIHTREKPFRCEVCGKQCSQSYNLKVHMRIHSNAKAFTCQHCGQGFNYNTSLQGHIRSKHVQVGTVA